jgi:hypothetical protein
MTSLQKLRDLALSRAVTLGIPQKWSAETTVKAAEKFEAYLKGKDEEDDLRPPSAFGKPKMDTHRRGPGEF